MASGLSTIRSHLPSLSYALNQVKAIYQRVKAQGFGRTIQKLFDSDKNYMIRDSSSGCHRSGIEYERKHKESGNVFVETPKKHIYFLKDREGYEINRNFMQYLADQPARVFLNVVLPEDRSKLK